MNRIGFFPSFAMLVAMLALSGCEQARSAIGLEKQPPDEFAVVTRAPLSLPPDFSLRPPAPGTQRPQEATVRDEARDILLRNSGVTPEEAARQAVASKRYSPGEAAFLAQAGALNADSGIRQIVDRESSAIAEADTGLLDKVIFWQTAKEPGTIVDAEKEAGRLREVRAMGDALNKGDVPVIERKQRGWLEGIF